MRAAAESIRPTPGRGQAHRRSMFGLEGGDPSEAGPLKRERVHGLAMELARPARSEIAPYPPIRDAPDFLRQDR
jgi:hypothetical protein